MTTTSIYDPRRKTTRAGRQWAIMIAALVAVFVTLPAMAATFTVSNLSDTGVGSLRQALTSANSMPTGAPHTIAFDGSLNGTVQLGSELPVLAYDMIVDGPGADKVTVTRSSVAEFRILTSAASALTVNGLTITNGVAEEGGGIYSSGSLEIVGCVISGNSAIGADSFGISEPISASHGRGGGVFSQLDLTVTTCTISSNLAAGGAGVTGGQSGANGEGGGLFSMSNITITDSAIYLNTALGGDGLDYNGGTGFGGGIYSYQALTIYGSSVGSNVATGGGSLGSEPGQAGNAFGGGAFVLGDCTITDGNFAGNRAVAGQIGSSNGYAVGGGLNTNASEITIEITDSAFANNSAEGVPGSINGGGEGYGGAMAFYNADVSISRTRFTGNSTSSADVSYAVSSVLDLYSCYTTVNDCLFASNDASGDASYTGAIVVDGGFFTLANSTVADNTNVNTGGGLFSSVDCSAVVNSIFWGNTSSQIVFMNLGEGEGQGEGGTTLGGNLSLGEGGTSAGVSYSIVEGGFSGTANLATDPLFRDTESGDYQLLPGSPAIDSADEYRAAPMDLNGNYRVDDYAVTNTGTGSGNVDRGAFEFQPSEFLTQEITLIAGWNLISVPFVPLNSSIAANFGSGAFAYRWDATTQDYAEITTITAGQGFFLFTDTASTVMLYSMTAASNYVRPMEYYWNVIGPTEDGQTFDAVSNVIVVYTYDGTTDSYDLVSPSGGKYTLESGVGYYIFVFPPFNLTLNPPPPLS